MTSAVWTCEIPHTSGQYFSARNCSSTPDAETNKMSTLRSTLKAWNAMEKSKGGKGLRGYNFK